MQNLILKQIKYSFQSLLIDVAFTREQKDSVSNPI